MINFAQGFALIVVIALAVASAGWQVYGNRARRVVAGAINRAKADSQGHTRGIVQVDLMRQIMARQSRMAPPVGGEPTENDGRVPSHDHPLLNKLAPAIVLNDVWGQPWDVRAEVGRGPVVVVFYLGSTCMACVTHLTELDVALPRFRQRGARVLAVSADTAEFTLERMGQYGGFRFPLLSDPNHAAGFNFGVWKPVAGANNGAGTGLHGVFIIDGGGRVRWVRTGNRPFTDIDALVAEIDAIGTR